MGAVRKERSFEYWETLQRLIQSKIDRDLEHSLQGDFNELRDDLKNLILKEFNKNSKPKR